MAGTSSKARKLPDIAIEWVKEYLTSKIGVCVLYHEGEMCTNRKPYKGLSKRATTQLKENGVIDCLTGACYDLKLMKIA